jgi:hypothetical protein
MVLSEKFCEGRFISPRKTLCQADFGQNTIGESAKKGWWPKYASILSF